MRTMGLVRAGVLAAGAGTLALIASNSPPASPAAEATSTRATAPVDAVALTCPGGSRSAHSNVWLASAPEELAAMLKSGGEATLGPVAPSDSTPPNTLTARGEARAFPADQGPLSVRAQGALAPGLAAGQYVTGKGTLTAQSCANPGAQAWIPVGDKSSGRLLTLVLVNEGNQPASVDVDVRSADGEVAAAAIVDKAVPPRSRVEVNLPAEATAHEAPAVHVRSDGGAVHASVRDRSTTGESRGEDVVSQFAAPSTVQSLPGVVVADGKARVRLVAADERAAVVRLQAWSGTSGGAARESVVTVPAGRTKDVTIDGLSGDFAAVRATSETAIVAAGLGPSSGKAVTDFAWTQAAPDIAEAAGTSLEGSGASGRLVVMGDGRPVAATLVVVDTSGKVTKRPLAVPATGSVSVALSKEASAWLTAPTREGASGVHANVIVRGDGGAVAVNTLVPSAWTRAPITVVQR